MLFVGRAIEMLVKDGVRVTKLIQFSDGCACQYKSKTNFADVSHSKEDFSIASEKHFFGSRHGKGPCDREIGVLKKTITMAVASGQVHVGTPMEFYTACKERLSIPKDKGHVHTKRRFVYIEKNDINRVRPDRSQVQSVKGTRKTHCVIGIKPYTIRVQERSCFGKACQDDSSSCPNKDITGPWTTVTIKKAPPPTKEIVSVALPLDTDDPQAPDNDTEETSASLIPPPDLNQLEKTGGGQKK